MYQSSSVDSFVKIFVKNLKDSDNSEQKIIFRFLSKFLSHFFGVKNLKLGSLFFFDNFEQKNNFSKKVMSISIFELKKYEGSIVGGSIVAKLRFKCDS